jgi:glycosyltransferase involved in cell wall biosynthesis
MVNKLLFLVPSETASGGIKNYFQVLKNEFNLPVEYMIRGARNWPYRNSFFQELKRALIDLKVFRKRISDNDIALVQTSTSLGAFSVLRDGLFIYFANRKGIKTIVFFRGWNIDFEKKIEKYYLNLFRFFIFRADSFIVLSSTFKNKLLDWGYKENIYLESTIIDEELLKEISQEKLLQNRGKRRKEAKYNILFLARIEKAKGIYEAIETFRIVKSNNRGKQIKLFIAGSGKELNNVRLYVDSLDLNEDIIFLGHVDGDNKKVCFSDADVYLFPSYTEGMPNSVLEAMAFGLPIITRDVGAIPDIIQAGINGFYTDSKDPNVFAEMIQKLMDDDSLVERIFNNNYKLARDKYITSKVVDRIEKIYKNTIDATTNSTT